eukprot:SAG31_NODE_12874_length_909_cov_18.612346_1_plen_62_part_10
MYMYYDVLLCTITVYFEVRCCMISCRYSKVDLNIEFLWSSSLVCAKELCCTKELPGTVARAS